VVGIFKSESADDQIPLAMKPSISSMRKPKPPAEGEEKGEVKEEGKGKEEGKEEGRTKKACLPRTPLT